MCCDRSAVALRGARRLRPSRRFDPGPRHCDDGRGVAHFTFIRPGESPELGEDIRELFENIAASLPESHRVTSGACHPPLDVYEDDDSIEIVVDVSGIAPAALRVLFRAGVVLIAGEKAPGPSQPGAEFHLVEREFGRFARAVRLTGALDAESATAALHNGELHVSVPKRLERRGQSRIIPISAVPQRST
jgi:HSP20 family protein